MSPCIRRSFVRPAALAPGRHVRLVAPSSPFDMQDFERGVERLRARYRVSFEAGIASRAGYLAGSDARRRAEIEAALDDPDVDAIVCARGGYGAMRIVADLDPARIAARPKVIIGFSDVTALHALWARAGVCSIHGTMVAGLGRIGETALARWIAALEGAPPPPIEGLRTIAAGAAEGPMLGGNLSLLAAMVGTPLFPPLEGAILFLEDVGEAPYRVDRMLTQLSLSGALRGVAGIALGAFQRADPGPAGTTVEQVLCERLGALGVPVVAGIPAGHVEEPLEIPLGVPARLEADRGRLTFLESPVSRAAA